MALAERLVFGPKPGISSFYAAAKEQWTFQKI
jgi:hypothetical protein